MPESNHNVILCEIGGLAEMIEMAGRGEHPAAYHAAIRRWLAANEEER